MKPAIVLLLLLSFSLFIPLAFADGMIHVYDPDMTRWGLQREERQLAVINYDKGIEKMLIAVELGNLQGKKAVWIFAIPAKPESTEIDILEDFPRLNGVDLKTKRNQVFGDALTITAASQVYLAPLFLVTMQTLGSSGQGLQGLDIDSKGVVVYESVQKAGLTSEVLTAKDGTAFYNYLIEQGFEIPKNSKELLDDYIGKDYSFVVSWVSGSQELAGERALGLFVSFPAEKIYFPLKPTSIYQNAQIPIVVYVIGHVAPKVFPSIQNSTSTQYFVQNYFTPSPELSYFFGGANTRQLAYTKVKITASSSDLTEDLLFENSAPPELVFSKFVVQNSLGFTILLFIIISCIASALAGAIVFRSEKPSLGKFALFGLANFLTLIGFSILACVLKIDERFSKSEKSKKSAGLKKVLWISAIFALGISILLLSPMLLIVFGSDAIAGFILLLFLLPIFFLFFFIIAAPFVWGFYNNKKLMKFTLTFTILLILIIVLSFLVLAFL